MCEIADRLDSRLKDEERWDQFYKYKQATTMNTTPTAGQDLFPIVTQLLDKYLTEPINNTIKTEMSQCLFVSVNMIELNNDELNCEQVCCCGIINHLQYLIDIKQYLTCYYCIGKFL